MKTTSVYPSGCRQKQLRYLKLLAQRTGSTFVTPKSRREASSEIDRLRSKKRKK